MIAPPATSLGDTEVSLLRSFFSPTQEYLQSSVLKTTRDWRFMSSKTPVAARRIGPEAPISSHQLFF
jgi:hypothetical protein